MKISLQNAHRVTQLQIFHELSLKVFVTICMQINVIV